MTRRAISVRSDQEPAGAADTYRATPYQRRSPEDNPELTVTRRFDTTLSFSSNISQVG